MVILRLTAATPLTLLEIIGEFGVSRGWIE